MARLETFYKEQVTKALVEKFIIMPYNRIKQNFPVRL